ncbi:fatty acid synthase, partial [Elysia marginata]
MFPNWISFFFDLRGPSTAYNTACSTGLVCLEAAERHLRMGVIDNAVVGGCNFTYRPSTSRLFMSMNFLGSTGCRAFDVSGRSSSSSSNNNSSSSGSSSTVVVVVVVVVVVDHNFFTNVSLHLITFTFSRLCSVGDGFVRAEVASVILLKKAATAKRMYGTLVGSMLNNDGFQTNGILYPNSLAQEQLMADIYPSLKVDPKDLKFFECHGTGTQAGDPNETRAICNAVCKHRKEPLLIGSVKTNLGHGETAS